MKYIICETDSHILPVIFDDQMVHLVVATSIFLHNKSTSVVSAGFIRHANGAWECYGESESLSLGSIEGDGALIGAWLAGYSGLNLMNLRMAIEMGLAIPERIK